MERLGLHQHDKTKKTRFYIIRSEKIKGTIAQISRDINQTHWKATVHANVHHPGKTIAIFEDDCRMIEEQTATSLSFSSSSSSSLSCIQSRLLAAFEYISKLDPEAWHSLNLGQHAGGPIFKVKGQANLVYTSFPFAAHSIILNGYDINRMLEKFPIKKWRSPYCIEGFITIPTKRKFAVYPNVTLQCVIPRWTKKFLGNSTSFNQVAKTLNFSMLYVVWIVIIIILATVAIVVLVQITMKKKSVQ
jgi:hypothetical protein